MGSRTKNPNLPEDIVNSVLLKLPVKYLLRFKSCCKSWCCSIADTEFMRLHLHKSSTDISRQKFLFFIVVEGKIRHNFSFKVLSTEASISADSKVVSLDQPNIPGLYSKVHYLQVCSCSGLVFIYHLGDSMILWNPAIRKYKMIPKPHLSQQQPGLVMHSTFGLAYDFLAEDYKILCIHDLSKTYPRYFVEIYSVKNQSWRTIDNIFPVPTDFPLSLLNDPISLNGAIYIMAISGKGNGAEFEHSVISFDLSDEKSIVTPVPSECGKHLKLHAFGDRICLMGTVGKEISIWSLEKDGKTWNNITKFPVLGTVIAKRLYSGDAIFVKGYRNIGDIMCIKKNGNVLWRKHGDRFIEYNALKNEYTEFNLKEIPQNSGNNTLYVESLVSLKIPWD
ncbi:F-box/kelch-repeat protein At3g23880-like [Lycium barbarum]|uniref:F-box/kelch-repeat protein At3g23880-like n=1 Tax=Lycium barbarum TaxID=112863 RepID=UPI00293E437E|nr:F-box/kelch-repeat protein At3g23880-like [Lycium barbarum]